MKYVAKKLDSVSAKTDSVDHDATSAFPDISIIPTVSHAIARHPAAHQKHATLMDDALACQTFPVNSAHSAVLDTTTTHSVWRATAIRMVHLESLATTTVNAIARAISMARRAINAKRVSTTFPLAKNATAIQLV